VKCNEERLVESLQTRGFRNISKSEWIYDTKLCWEVRVAISEVYGAGYNWWLAPLPCATFVPSKVVVDTANMMAVISLEITR